MRGLKRFLFLVCLTFSPGLSFGAGESFVISYQEPPDTDLASCRIFVRNAQGGVLAEQTFAILPGAPGSKRDIKIPVPTTVNLNTVEKTKGTVLGRCEDVNGGVSIDSAPFEFPFPVIPPGSVRILSITVGN